MKVLAGFKPFNLSFINIQCVILFSMYPSLLSLHITAAEHFSVAAYIPDVAHILVTLS